MMNNPRPNKQKTIISKDPTIFDNLCNAFRETATVTAVQTNSFIDEGVLWLIAVMFYV
jgi:hypothetical protein